MSWDECNTVRSVAGKHAEPDGVPSGRFQQSTSCDAPILCYIERIVRVSGSFHCEGHGWKEVWPKDKPLPCFIDFAPAAVLYTCNSRMRLSPQVDALNEKFAEARDEIEYAQEDAETVRHGSLPTPDWSTRSGSPPLHVK